MTTSPDANQSKFALMFSYSGYFLLEPEATLLPIQFEFDGRQITLNPPIRLGARCWRPIPMLDEASATRVLGNDLIGIPLQVAAVPSLGLDGSPSMELKAGRGGEFEATAPPDTLLLIAHDADEEYPTGPLQEKVVEPFLQMLRVSTRQWWIGRSIEKQTGNLHFGFQITGDNQLGPVFTPLCKQTAPDAGMQRISQEVWADSLRRVLAGESPPWDQTILADVQYYKSNNEYPTSTLLICGWAEVERDLVLEHRGVKLSALNVSKTDILKQLSVGFGSALGANLREDLPREFELLRSFWRARGSFAHGKPFEWEFEGHRSLRDFQELPLLLENLRLWFASLRIEKSAGLR